jgi:hypothetical protein
MSFSKLVRRANAKQQTIGRRTKAFSLKRVCDDLSGAFLRVWSIRDKARNFWKQGRQEHGGQSVS